MNLHQIDLDLSAARLARAEHLARIQGLRQQLRDEQAAFKEAGRVVNRHRSRLNRFISKPKTNK